MASPAEPSRRPVPAGPSRRLLRLAEWAGNTYAQLLLMGFFLILLGGLGTLLSFLLFRDAVTGEFRVWWYFLGTGAACLAAGGLWRWRAGL